MPKVNWTDDSILPSYFNHNGIYFEKHFQDVSSIENGYQTIPIDFDVTHYGVFYENFDNITIHENDADAGGCFYAPFLLYENKDQLINNIISLVEFFSQKTKLLELKVFIFRHIDKDQKRHIAIAVINHKKKHKKIKELGIKTLCPDIGPVDIYALWTVLSKEMYQYKEDSTFCQIEKNEIFPFDESFFAIPSDCTECLALCPQDKGYNAEHYIGKTNRKFHITQSRTSGSFFSFPFVDFQTEKDLNNTIHWLSRAYRTISGDVTVKILASFSRQPGKIVASIVAFKNSFSWEFEEESDL